MSNLAQEYYNLFKANVGWFALLFSLAMVAKVLGLRLFPAEPVSYAALLLVALFYLKHGLRFDSLSLAFAIYLPISVAIDSPPAIFNSWMRLGLFALVFFVASPLISSRYATSFRQRIFAASLACCALVGAISFVCYFLGINLRINVWTGDYAEYLETVGAFGGICSHSMLLGPISGVGAIACSYMALTRNKYWWAIAAMCAGAMLFAASRSSLIATLAGVVTLFYFSTKNVGKNTRRIIIAVGLLLVTNPLWNSALDGVMKKNQGSIYEGVNYSSRTPKWNLRLEEWESSPIFGVGFCAVSEKDDIAIDGKIEPGSSWLAVLSMTGTVGFILFCMIFGRAAKNSLSPRTPEAALAGAVLIMLGVHMLAEGHVFSGGSYLCFLVWLAIGHATDA